MFQNTPDFLCSSRTRVAGGMANSSQVLRFSGSIVGPGKFQNIPSADLNCCSHSTVCWPRRASRDTIVMLYRGDFVYTETLSDLKICRDYLLGKF